MLKYYSPIKTLNPEHVINPPLMEKELSFDEIKNCLLQNGWHIKQRTIKGIKRIYMTKDIA